MCGRGEMRPFAVALTGGIGSGKSVVAAYLRENGVPVYDSDSQAKKLYLDGGFLSRIEEVLGCTLRPGGVFDVPQHGTYKTGDAQQTHLDPDF